MFNSLAYERGTVRCSGYGVALNAVLFSETTAGVITCMLIESC